MTKDTAVFLIFTLAVCPVIFYVSMFFLFLDISKKLEKIKDTVAPPSLKEEVKEPTLNEIRAMHGFPPVVKENTMAVKVLNIRGEHWEVVNQATRQTICSGDTKEECLQAYNDILEAGREVYAPKGRADITIIDEVPYEDE